MASLAERSASPWTATSMRDRPAGCSTCASSLCGALCGEYAAVDLSDIYPLNLPCENITDGSFEVKRDANVFGKVVQRTHPQNTQAVVVPANWPAAR